MKNKLIFVLLIGLVLRFFLIFVAFHGDLNNNFSWGDALLRYGAKGFYEQKVWLYSAPNQPPLYILLFGLTSFLNKNIGSLVWYLNNNLGVFPSSLVWFWQNNGNIILLKLPSIFADLGIGYLIYFAFKSRKKEKMGLILATIWLFNPITMYNSSVWGQTDPIVNLFGLVSILALLRKDLKFTVLFIVISLLFKGSLIIFLPVILLVLILQKHSMEKWIKAFLLSGVVTVLITFWFHPSIDLPIWLFNLYTNRFFPGEIGYLTANGFNLWYLVDPGKVLDSVKYFGFTAHTLGYLITFVILGTVILKTKEKILEEKTILFLLAISALTTFLFFTRIHERYLYPFFPVATLLIGFMPEFFIPYLVLTFTFLLNMYNLFWAPGIASLVSTFENTQLPSIVSLTNLVTLFSSVFLFFKKPKVHH